MSNPYQAPTADSPREEGVDLSRTTVGLWNPRRLGVFAFFFGAHVGAFLQAQNWKALGNYEEAKRSYRWMWAWFAIMTIGVISELSELALNGVGLVFFLIWLSTLSRQSHYLMTEQIKFTKKSWIIAVGIWGLLTLAFFVLILILSFVYLAVTESIIASGSLIRVDS